ncbi:MAG TPA: hypothetical protein VFS20_05285, partial [Longimicrobium sp.]|nr:hypothetical protein [Longimicrobium sp.]
MIRREGLAALAGWLVLTPAAASAQDSTAVRVDSVRVVMVDEDTAVHGAGDAAPVFRASPLLPFEHWAVQAARRAEALGLTRFFPAQRSVPRAQVARALHEAARSASTPAVRRVAEGWRDRFVEEFPEYAAPAGARTLGGVTVL